MKKLWITGYSSNIAQEFISLVKEKYTDINISTYGRNSDANFKVDFSKVNETREFINNLTKKPPDFLFVNHGVLPGNQIRDTSTKDINNSVHVNLVSYLFIIESLAKIEGINTVIMSSISGKVGSYDTLYAATKAGIDVTVRRQVLGLPANSRLNAVSPGIVIDAKMTKVRTDLHILEQKKNTTPTKQFTTSIDVAKLVYYIMFEAQNMQGENINLNGGMFIK